MNKNVKLDLADLQFSMEDLAANLPNLTMKHKVDVAARLRAVAKACDAIDKAIKDEIKTIRNGEPGTVVGDMFKANLTIVPTTRLDQQKLQVDFPRVYAKCLVKTDVVRISFEPR